MSGLVFGNLRETALAAKAKMGGAKIPPKGRYNCKLMSVGFTVGERSAKKMAKFKWMILKVEQVANPDQTQEADSFRGKEVTQNFVLEGPGFGYESFSRTLVAVCDEAGIDPDAFTSEQDMENLFLDLAATTIVMPMVMGPDKDPKYLKAYPADKSTNAIPVRPDAVAPVRAPQPLPQDRPAAPRAAAVAPVAQGARPAPRAVAPAPVARAQAPAQPANAVQIPRAAAPAPARAVAPPPAARRAVAPPPPPVVEPEPEYLEVEQEYAPVDDNTVYEAPAEDDPFAQAE